MKGRHIRFLSIPVAALLEVLSGRATVELPSDIPLDIQFLYSYIVPDDQALRVAVTHPTFPEKQAGDYVQISHLKITEKPVPPPEPAFAYDGKSLLESDDWDRQE